MKRLLRPSVLIVCICIAATIYILVSLQQSQAPEDSSASKQEKILPAKEWKKLSTKQITENSSKLGSQYDPSIVIDPETKEKIMYYCKNSGENGIGRDRIWRATLTQNNTLISTKYVIEGEMDKDNDLSCAPTVAIDPYTGTWKMYYLGANRQTPREIYLYYAESHSPGTQWNVQGKVHIPFAGENIGNPSIVIKNNQHTIYYTAEIENTRKLLKIQSTNPLQFPEEHTEVILDSSHVPLSAKINKHEETFFLSYVLSCNTPELCTNGIVYPNEIFIATSNDGINFSPGTSVISTYSNDNWNGGVIWTPHLFFDGVNMQIFHAGSNRGSDYPYEPKNWFSASAIGVTVFDATEITENATTTHITTSIKQGSVPENCPPLDRDNNQKINLVDIAYLAKTYGMVCTSATDSYICESIDVNNDGKVDRKDFVFIKSYYQQQCF